MLVPVELRFAKRDTTQVIMADTERMYDRIAEMLVDVLEGRRKNPVVMSEQDMDGVSRAFVSNILPGDPYFDNGKAVRIIDHGGYVWPLPKAV